MNRDKKPSPLPQAGVARVPMRSSLPDKELQRYRDSGSVIALQPGETLFEQGSDPEEMYAVLRGTLAVIMDGVQVAEIGEGQVAGEMAFLLSEKRTATLRALDNCEVHAISPLKMKMLMQHPEVAFGLLQLFSRRVEAANRALLVRTQTAQNARLALEEERRESAALSEAMEARGRQLIEQANAVAVTERIAKEAAIGNLEAADARIKQLEAALKTVNVTVAQDGTIGRTFPRPMEAALELEIDNDLDLLAPPPALPPPLPQPIGKIGLKQVAVALPKPAPVFTEEGPTEKMEAMPEPLPKKQRTDDTMSYQTERSSAETEVPMEVRADEYVVVTEEPPTTKRREVPVGGRTQTMMAFDPNAPMKEIVIDDRGSRPSISIPPPAAVLENETDDLIAELSREILAMPDATPKK